MIALPRPPLSLPPGRTWRWRPRDQAWVRIYHRDRYTPSAIHRRAFGPLHRFDHHSPASGPPAVCPQGRTIVYLAATIRAATAEVFGDLSISSVCPHWRVAWVRPASTIIVQDLVGPGAAALGTRPWLGSGDEAREDTQLWAREIYEQHPDVQGIRYRGSHEEGHCLALWERAADLEMVTEAGRIADTPLRSPGTWNEVLEAYSETGCELEPIDSALCSYCRAAHSVAVGKTA